jgi:hypothetical protein
MRGQFFVHMQQLKEGPINLRTGFVKAQLGPANFLLHFDGSTFPFSNVFTAEQLGPFVFFDTEADRLQFLTELQKEGQPNNPPPTDDSPSGSAPN